MNNERDLLNKRLEECLEQMEESTHEPGTKAYAAEVYKIKALAELAIKYDEVALEADNAVAQNELKEKETVSTTATEIAKAVLKTAGEVSAVVIPCLLYQKWLKWGFEFEQTGVFTSTTFKGLFNRMRPTSF